jgi:hypothetical protein
MELDSYICENCIMQKEEIVIHLFLRCNFARRCWQTIGVTTPRSSDIHNMIRLILQRLDKKWKVETVIVMMWCIWKCINGWENIPPTEQGWQAMFRKEMLLICYKLKQEIVHEVKQWLNTL